MRASSLRSHHSSASVVDTGVKRPRSNLPSFSSASSAPSISAVSGRPSESALIDGALLALENEGKRSEEHTSELQSHSDLVCRLLLEKKNKRNNARFLQLRV